ALCVPVGLLLAAAEPALSLARQPVEVVPLSAAYVDRVIPSVLPLYVFVVLRQTLQAHRRTAPIVVTVSVANVMNAVLNYGWIYGGLGFPALGVVGAAWATTVSRWAMAAMLLCLGWPVLRPYLERVAPRLLAARAFARMLR